jgi:hypothetical protein
MNKLYHLLPVAFGCLALSSCEQPFSIVLHDPISPNPGTAVNYSIEMQGGTAPKSVRLYEQVSTMSLITIPVPFGSDIEYLMTVPQPEQLVNTWNNPAIGTLTFTRTSGIPRQCLITYRFEVTQSNNQVVRHTVTYASRDYPMQNDPLPVYVVGDAANTFDVVFIPDTDIGNLDDFRTHVRRNIREAFFQEQSTKLFRHSFNFYINRQTGHATDFDKIATDGNHQPPSNNAWLSFAEGRVLLHQNNLRDYASGGLYSTEMQNRGTIMHESGHGLFGLADEYDGGAHWQDADLPNNWNSLSGAQGAASGRGKSNADAVEIGDDDWFKLCIGTCQMNTTGLNLGTYDRPCKDRVISEIVDVGNP